jgi:hypothetical protein
MRIMMAGMMCVALLSVPALADPIDDAFAPWSGRDRPGCAGTRSRTGSSGWKAAERPIKRA